MIIFIYNQDDWRALQRKNEVIQKFQQKHQNFEINNFNLEDDFSLENLLNFLKNQSLFEKVRLGIIYNLFSTKEKELINQIKSVLNSKNTHLIIYEKNIPPKQFSFLLKPPALFEKFEALTGKDLINFVLKESKKRNVNFTPTALNFFIQALGNDSFKIITELEKLSLLNKSKIDLKDLNELNIEIQPDFWFLLNQLKTPNLKTRMQAFEKILNFKEPLGKIFNILAYSWNEKIENFAIYDRAIKSGKLDYDEALLDAIL
ncbi:MAG: DNA polymerase III subunit delta [Minisyncoccia bacterium]